MKSPLRATFWKQATEGVTYVRCELPARHLPGQVLELGLGDLKEDEEGLPFLHRQEGAAVWSFPGNTTRAILMVSQMDQGIPVFVEADDNYWVDPPCLTHPMWGGTDLGWKHTLKQAIGRDGNGVIVSDGHSYEAHKRISSWVDGVIVSTPRLAEMYSSLNDNVHVCRNHVDRDDWPADPPWEYDGKLHIGWAASDSHVYDASIVERALGWASQQPDVEITIMGIKRDWLPWRFPYWHLDWLDNRAEYHDALGLIDVMVCPLKRSFWADAKSDVKALEASMAGALPVVQDAPPFEPWIDRTFSCKTEKDWLKAIKHLVRNRDEARELAVKAREYVLAEREIRRGVDEWRVALDSVGTRSGGGVRGGHAVAVGEP